ncbi:MAG: hypothetical protein ACI3XG_02035, partial [Faecousia sp.]
VNARIQQKVTRREAETTAYEVEIDFQRTSSEYLELGDYYPQQLPEGCQCTFISDKSLGFQRLVFENAAGEFAFDLTMELGSEGLQKTMTDVISEETVMIGTCPGTLYSQLDGSRSLTWYDEAAGVGFFMTASDASVDLLAIARSVAPSEPLTPTRSAGQQKALEELGDYRITGLPENYSQTDLMASPLEDGGGWYAYVRRWYGDKVSTDSTVYFEYEHFNLVSDEPSNHETAPVENSPETILEYRGGGEPITIQNMPAAIADGRVSWVDWENQVVFSIIAGQLGREELIALAQSVQRFAQ